MPKTPLGTLDDAHLSPLALTPLDSSRYGHRSPMVHGGAKDDANEDGAAYSDVVAADIAAADRRRAGGGNQQQDANGTSSASSGTAAAAAGNGNQQPNPDTTQEQQQQTTTTTNNIYLPQLDGTSSAGSSKDEDDQHHQQQHNKNQTDAATDDDDKTGASSSNDTNTSKDNDNDTGKQNKSQKKKKKKDTSPNLKRRKLSYDPSADQANDEGAGGSGNGGYRKPPIAPKPLPLGHMRHLSASASASANGTGAAGGAAGSLRSVSMTDAESRIVNDADGGVGGADSASSQPKEGGGASADAGTGAGGMAASRSPNGIRRSPSAAKVNRMGSPSGSPPPKVAALLRPKFDTPNGSTSSSSANNNNNNNNSATANASPSTNANPSSNVAVAAGAQRQQDQDQHQRQGDRHRPISPSPHGTKGKRGKHVITPSGEGNSDSESSTAAVLASQVQAISKKKEKDASKNDQGANAGWADESAASDASTEDQKKRVQTPTNELLAQQTDGIAGYDGGAHSAQPNHPPFSPWTSYLAKDRSAAPPAGLATPRGDNLRTPRVFDFLGVTPRGQYRDEGSVTFARNLAAINSPGPQAAHHRRNDSFGSGLFPNAALSPFHAGTPKDHRSIHRMGSQDSTCPSESEAFQSLLHASDALFGTAADPRHAGEDGGSLNSTSSSIGGKKRGRPRKDSTAFSSATAKKRRTKSNRKYALPTGNFAKKGPHASGSARRSRSSRGIGAPGLNPQASPRSLLMDSRGGSRSLADDLRHSPTGPPSVRRTFHDGEYEGQIVGDGRRHGYGVIHFVDGDKYAGWWNDDVMDGMGRMEYSDG